jgi:hypothetical protein
MHKLNNAAPAIGVTTAFKKVDFFPVIFVTFSKKRWDVASIWLLSEWRCSAW